MILMVVEVILFALSIAAVVSSIDFISKSVSSITRSFGVPEYLASTIILSFIISLPTFLIMFFSNVYGFPTFGVMTIIGTSIATISLIMGLFLLKNKISVAYERYRNATFMWASALLFLIVSLDNFIDRFDAIFMLLLFFFYCVYIFYRTGKSKEFVFLKPQKTKLLLLPFGILTIAIICFVIVATTAMISTKYLIDVSIFGLTVLGLLLSLPLLDLIKNVFKTPTLTFDSLIGNLVVMLTVVPAVTALYCPFPYDITGNYGLAPLIILNIITLSFALATRLRENLSKGTGIILILLYIGFLAFFLI